MSEFGFLDFNLVPLLPEVFLALSAMGFLLIGVSFGDEARRVIPWYALLALLMTGVLVSQVSFDDAIVLGGMFKADAYSGFVKLLIIGGVMATLGLSMRYLEQEHIDQMEFYVLVLLASVGMMFMVSAVNLLSLYMALELQSLSLYVLAAFNRQSPRAAEAGVKYFALGGLASGMMLFGISLIYGFTGSLDFGTLTASMMVMQPVPFAVIFGLVFLLAGLAFKLSAAPFHMWTPDVYEGAPTAVTALFAMVPKLAALALLMRILFEPFAYLVPQWEQIIIFLAVMSMIVGAFGAIAQSNIKRLIAYSSIGHIGYALIGVAAASEGGINAVLLHMLIYMAMTAGTFAVIMAMRRGGRSVERIDDLAGLSRSQPILAYALGILMFSMAGVPPFAGFFGKLMIFQAAIGAELYALAIFGVVASVVAAYYYLRIVKVMFFDEAVLMLDLNVLSGPQRFILACSVAFVLFFILSPSAFIDSTQLAAAALFPGR
ncbi:MAG: NADH-quinone oxidoreductase subunit NuoN [Alphaproteobacteria bacterium]|nr:NADH-quinone oxidoreductase subunit NuoN [Alphaproteobacteria bacterium]